MRWDRRNRRRGIFSKKRTNARRDGVLFTIAFEEIEWPERCPALGTLLDYEGVGLAGRDLRCVPSFDRIDPSLGYVSGNVRIISFAANTIKHNGCCTPGEIKRVAEWLAATAVSS